MQPPGFRRAEDPARTCHTCSYVNTNEGLCLLYDWRVTRDDTCDAWQTVGRSAEMVFRHHPEAFVNKED